MKKPVYGFTLLELLAVITIIGILVTLAAIALANATKRARDARRQSDINNIQRALELYNQENGSYPATIAALAPNFIATIPSDPKDKAAYNLPAESTRFAYALNGTTDFIVGVNLEYTNITNPTYPTGTAPTCPASATYTASVTKGKGTVVNGSNACFEVTNQ